MPEILIGIDAAPKRSEYAIKASQRASKILQSTPWEPASARKGRNDKYFIHFSAFNTDYIAFPTKHSSARIFNAADNLALPNHGPMKQPTRRVTGPVLSVCQKLSDGSLKGIGVYFQNFKDSEDGPVRHTPVLKYSGDEFFVPELYLAKPDSKIESWLDGLIPKTPGLAKSIQRYMTVSKSSLEKLPKFLEAFNHAYEWFNAQNDVTDWILKAVCSAASDIELLHHPERKAEETYEIQQKLADYTLAFQMCQSKKIDTSKLVEYVMQAEVGKLLETGILNTAEDIEALIQSLGRKDLSTKARLV